MEARKEPDVVSEPEDHVPISQIFSRKVPCDSTSSFPSETQVNRYACKDDGSVQRGRNPKDGSGRGVMKEASDNLVASVGCKRKKEVHKVSGPFEAQCSLLMERAREFQAKLSSKFPSVIKLLTRSHVTRGFWMGLPTEFCRSHLPKNSTIVVLEDENGKEYEANYLAERQAISGGWQRFSTDHKLIEGDIAIFQLIKPHRFKVYTIRAYDACVEETETGSVAADSEDFGPVAADFEDFTMSANGLVVDTLLSREIRQSYHKLCCSQKSYLHSKLIKSVDESTSVARIIFKTVHIAKAIRSCNLSTSQRDLEMWDKTLKEFEDLGMKVGFLRQRIKRLMRLALDLTAESERYEEVRNERDRAETKMKSLEMDFLELRKRYWKLEGEKKDAKVGARKYEVMFQEQADAPW